jgi:hypothetical protein
LLGGHVGESAHDLAGNGDESLGGFGEVLGEAEIEDAELALIIDEDVGGFEVAVHDALLVGVIDGIAGGGEELEGFVEGEFARVDEVGEWDAADEVHDEVKVTVRSFAGAEDGDDAGMAEGGDEFDFAFEAVASGLGGIGGVKEDLDGDLAFGSMLKGLVDDALAAVADFLEEGVAFDGGERGCGSGGKISGEIARGGDLFGEAAESERDEALETREKMGATATEVVGGKAAGGFSPAREKFFD